MDEEFDLESMANVEQKFYDIGYADGFAHGHIHGLIEGRSLGRTKGFEIWEELGFYEGYARMWGEIFAKQGRLDDRAASHIRHLLDLVNKFPRINPSASDISSELDVPKLFRQIRSRYKALCSTLGVYPSLRYSEKTEDQEVPIDTTVLVEGDKRSKSGSIWRLEPQVPSGDALEF